MAALSFPDFFDLTSLVHLVFLLVVLGEMYQLSEMDFWNRGEEEMKLDFELSRCSRSWHDQYMSDLSPCYCFVLY